MTSQQAELVREDRSTRLRSESKTGSQVYVVRPSESGRLRSQAALNQKTGSGSKDLGPRGSGPRGTVPDPPPDCCLCVTPSTADGGHAAAPGVFWKPGPHQEGHPAAAQLQLPGLQRQQAARLRQGRWTPFTSPPRPHTSSRVLTRHRTSETEANGAAGPVQTVSCRGF